ncbi:hypothetical protein PRIC1_013827 [Phytophthora ramorum]
MDFRTELEGDGGFHEVIPILDRGVVERVHMNFRIQVIKDNVLSRTLPDGCVLLLEHMTNENNYHILSYISETEDYWKSITGLISSKDKRLDGLGLLKAIIYLIRGPDRLRAYLASEGKCIPAPTSDKDRITWTSDSSLFTAMLIVFERDEPMRIQLFNLLREIFRVPIGHDDKFLSVLYPNYMHWLLQPLKNNTFVHDESAMFDLQDSIMELLTFCTENHGYRVKYLFGRQPISTYTEKMLRSENKLFVIHAVKFIRACAVRAEAFFSRFLIQNDLFSPMLANMEIGKPNSVKLTSLVEHIYTKFYETYKTVCPLVFEAIHTRYDGNSGSVEATMDSADTPSKVRFVRAGSIDDEEELYWEKDTDTNEPTPELDKNGLSECLMLTQEEVPCQNRPRSVKLVDYDDDDDETTTSQKEESTNSTSAGSPHAPASSIEEEHELKLPVRKKEEENVFQKISWNLATPDSNGNGTSIYRNIGET